MAQKLTEVNFGDSSIYVASSAVPDGNYALEFDFKLDRGKEGKGKERLVVNVKFHPREGDGKVFESNYGMGKTAHLSVRPHPENSKKLVAVPDGPQFRPNNNTKWAIFKLSMQNNDLAGDGDAPAQGPRQPGVIPVVSAIEDDGKPWEGGGGLPTAESEKPAKTKTAIKTAPATKAATKKAAKTSDDIMDVAESAIATWLGDNASGGSRPAMKVSCFNWIKKTYDDDKGQEFMYVIANDDDVLNSILEKFGFIIDGVKIKAA